MRQHVPPESGFLIEDKRFVLALHYRLADPDRALDLRLRLREFIVAHTPALVIGEGKMVIEARPRYANKGEALRRLAAGRRDREKRVTVYFGDDVTDEDAFEVLREDGGVTVRVCEPPVPSWARYRVARPAMWSQRWLRWRRRPPQSASRSESLPPGLFPLWTKRTSGELQS